MSIYIPECNANAQGNAGSVRISFPSGATFKPANTGFATGIFVRTPIGGYDGNVNYNILSRGTGNTSGADGYIRFNQGASQLTATFRNGGSNIISAMTLSAIPIESKLLIMFIVTAANVHLVACVPGSTPLVTTLSSSAIYALNLSANDVWAHIGAGNSVAYGHYGPVEEAFHINGLFPETSNVPDTTLIANIANGTQDLATLHSSMTSGTKKWRYRMLLQDTLNDSFGIASTLNVVNTTVDKVLLSSGPIRPANLTPNFVLNSASMALFSTPGVAASAVSDIFAEGGTFSGISPAAIHARLRKEDGSTLAAWRVVDAAPAGGTWQPYTFANVPLTAGDLTCDFKAVDGSGAQIGDIVASHGIKGSGFFMMHCSQSQGTFLHSTGTGSTSPANMRAQVTFYDDPASRWRTKRISSLNANSRVAKGMRRQAAEFNALYPGVPIHIATVGVQGQAIQNFAGGGAYAFLWSSMKSLLGTVQPFVLMMMGQNSGADATYEAKLNAVIAQAITDLGQPIHILHAEVPRYSGIGSNSTFTQVLACREGTRARVANNPTTDKLMAHPLVVKCDSNDVSPHPMDANVGQGRSGALLAWGVMSYIRAVEDVPLKIATATLFNGKTQVKLTLDKVNA